MTIKTNKTLALLCLIAAMILAAYSSTQTAIFYYNSSNDILSWVLIFVGLAMDFGKFGFIAYAGFMLNHEKYVKTIVYGLAGFICIGISFAASLGFDLNKTNEFKNEAIMTSTLYKTNTTLFESTSKSIEDLRADIKRLKDNKENDIVKIKESYQSRINDARSRNYFTTPKQRGISVSVRDLENDMNNDILSLDSTIKEKESELSAKEKNQGNVINKLKEASQNVNTTKGVYALAKYISPNNADAIAGNINLIKNLSIEIASILFAGAFGGFAGNVYATSPFSMFKRTKKNNEIKDEKTKNTNENSKTSNENSNIDNLDETQPQQLSPNQNLSNNNISLSKEKNQDLVDNTEIDELKNTIKALQDNIIQLTQQEPDKQSVIKGFQMDKSDVKEQQRKQTSIIKGVSNKKVIAYLDVMYNTSNNNITIGLPKICDMASKKHNIKITENTGKQIYGHLKHMGVIKPLDNKKTLILKDKNELQF
jgi:hypothetical protein